MLNSVSANACIAASDDVDLAGKRRKRGWCESHFNLQLTECKNVQDESANSRLLERFQPGRYHDK